MHVAIYIRKSSESEDRQVQSLEDQKKVLLAFAKRNGIHVAEILEESKSAKQPGNRPVFLQLIHKIESGEITGLLVWHMNRLSRNLLEGGQIAHLLHCGRLEFIKTPERTYYPDDSALLISIENGMATSFIQDLRRNTIRGMIGKAERGWKPTHPPIGYRYNKETHEIVIDPAKFAILRQCWELILTGNATVARAVKYAEELGLRHLFQSGHVPRSKLYKAFSDPFYYGEFEFRGKTYQGAHQPMISKAEFDRAQDILSGRLRSNRSKHNFTYSGLLKCGYCGCSITAERKTKHYKTTNRVATYVYYHCTGARGCRKCSVSETELDRRFGRAIIQFKLPPELLPWAGTEFKKYIEQIGSAEGQSVNLTKEKVSKLERRLKRLHQMRLDDEIEAAEYKELKTQIESELTELKTASAREITLENSLTAQIENRLALLEQVKSFEDLSSEIRQVMFRQLARNYFLTLENVEIEPDPIIGQIITFEPLKSSFQSYKAGVPVREFNVWLPLVDKIRTIIESGE